MTYIKILMKLLGNVRILQTFLDGKLFGLSFLSTIMRTHFLCVY